MGKRTLQGVLITSCLQLCRWLGSGAVGTASRQVLRGAGGTGSARGSSHVGVLWEPSHRLAASLIPCVTPSSRPSVLQTWPGTDALCPACDGPQMGLCHCVPQPSKVSCSLLPPGPVLSILGCSPNIAGGQRLHPVLSAQGTASESKTAVPIPSDFSPTPSLEPLAPDFVRGRICVLHLGRGTLGKAPPRQAGSAPHPLPGIQPSPKNTSRPRNTTCRAGRPRSSSRAMPAAELLASRCWGC